MPGRKNHYIPEFYTRCWANGSGEMIRFNKKPNGQIQTRAVTPGAIGFERDLYTIPDQEAREAQSLEDGLFRVIDNKAAVARDQLITGKIPKDSVGRSQWAAFILSLSFRSPRAIQAATKAFELLQAKQFPQLPPNPLGARQLALTRLWNAIENPLLSGVLVRMDWEVIDFSHYDISLLTNDDPLIMSNGLKPPNGNYALPLSPKKMFLCSWPGPERDRFCSLSKSQMAKRANKITAERARSFVIARHISAANFVEKHFGLQPILNPMEQIVLRYENGEFDFQDYP